MSPVVSVCKRDRYAVLPVLRYIYTSIVFITCHIYITARNSNGCCVCIFYTSAEWHCNSVLPVLCNPYVSAIFISGYIHVISGNYHSVCSGGRFTIGKKYFDSILPIHGGKTL